MKRQIIYGLLLTTLVGIVAVGCKKEDSAKVATLTTKEVTKVTQNTAESGGATISYGDANPTKRGICWATHDNPTLLDSTKQGIPDASNINNFTIKIAWLKANTTYYLSAYVTSSAGTGYGNIVSFTTLPAALPELEIADPGKVTRTTAEFDIKFKFNGGEPLTGVGVCWGTSENPTINDSKTVESTDGTKFSSTITGLTPNTTYYARAFATNSVGIVYGNDMLVRTMYGTVTDIDGNVYQTVLIGTQEWMAENLRVTHYRNGDPIPNVTDENQWDYLVTGAYCSYLNSDSIFSIYGGLYNWYAVGDSRGIAPTGWHVATNDEWNILEAYLGGSGLVGGKLKASDYVNETYDKANNSSGFTALLGGMRNSQTTISFENINWGGYMWTSTPTSSSPLIDAYSRDLLLGYSDIYSRGKYKRDGLSVRCIRD